VGCIGCTPKRIYMQGSDIWLGCDRHLRAMHSDAIGASNGGQRIILNMLMARHYDFASQEKLLPTVTTGWKLWIPAHAINFGFIPPSQRVLYVNVIAVSPNLLLYIFALHKSLLGIPTCTLVGIAVGICSIRACLLVAVAIAICAVLVLVHCLMLRTLCGH